MLGRQQRMQGDKLTATQRKHVIDTIVDNHAATSIMADTAQHGYLPVPVRLHDQTLFYQPQSRRLVTALPSFSIAVVCTHTLFIDCW
jgi:hypothetical protein